MFFFLDNVKLPAFRLSLYKPNPRRDATVVIRHRSVGFPLIVDRTGRLKIINTLCVHTGPGIRTLTTV